MIARRTLVGSLLGLPILGVTKVAKAMTEPAVARPPGSQVMDAGPGSIVLPSGASVCLTQGGTLAAPANENPLSIQPVDPTKAPFGVWLDGANFGWSQTIDVSMHVGYNCTGGIATEPQIRWSIEQDFEESPGVHYCEMHAQIYEPGVSRGFVRPFTAYYIRGSGLMSSGNGFANGGSYSVTEHDGDVERFRVDRNGAFVNASGSFSLTLYNDHVGVDGRAAALFLDENGLAAAAVGYYGPGATPTGVGTNVIASAGPDIAIVGCDFVPRILIDGGTDNIQLFSFSKSFGGGAGVIAIANATTVPSADPTGGGILFVQDGALMYRGSSGTVTMLAPA